MNTGHGNLLHIITNIVIILAILFLFKLTVLDAIPKTNSSVNNRISSLEQKMISRTKMIKRLGEEHNYDIMFIAE